MGKWMILVGFLMLTGCASVELPATVSAAKEPAKVVKFDPAQTVCDRAPIKVVGEAEIEIVGMDGKPITDRCNK